MRWSTTGGKLFVQENKRQTQARDRPYKQVIMSDLE